MSMFIRKLSIQNYKCFANEPINFSVPNGSRGSGLNILIGENGNGKTTILEAINYLTLNSYSAENKLGINDFCDYKKEILITGETDNFSCKSSIDFYKDWSFKAKGLSFAARSRDTKERNKLLSSLFQINNEYLTEGNYIKKDGSVGKELDSRDKHFDNSRIIEGELNIFYFDKNRTRQISSGTYKTTFEKICDDLNWNFVKNLNDENKEKILQNIVGEYFKNIEDIVAKNLGKKTVSDLKSFFEKNEYEKIKIELLDLLHPFSKAFFALREDDHLTQINVRDLGSGIEMILTLLLLKNIASTSKGSIIYLIDEPELHLHPKAQSQLLNLLIDESKDKQIIVSTQSPYLFKGSISENANLILCTRDQNGKVLISNARNKGWGLFPWSPSWGEINYFAYNMPTIEFHDELYGFLHEKYISGATTQKDADDRSKQTEFETKYLQTKISATKSWTREIGGKPQNSISITLPSFIRNKIHHPENNTMQAVNFNDAELKNSIDSLITITKNP